MVAWHPVTMQNREHMVAWHPVTMKNREPSSICVWNTLVLRFSDSKKESVALTPRYFTS